MRRVKRTISVLLFCVFAVAAGLPPAAAANPNAPVLARVVERGELRVGMSGGQPPFTMKSKDGDLFGYEVDLAEMLAGAMGVKLTLVEKPFGELLGALAKGEVDAVMSGMTITPARNLKAAFVGPYVVSGKSILTKDSTLAAADEVEDINEADIKLAALAGSTSQSFVERLIPEAQLTTVPDYDAGVKLVLEDKVHALVADYPICAISVLRYGDKGLVTLAAPLTIEPIGIALPPGDSLLLNLVENHLGALEALGILDELDEAWFEDASWLIHLP
jgi:polar amino acid transport system substrate-binding protein